MIWGSGQDILSLPQQQMPPQKKSFPQKQSLPYQQTQQQQLPPQGQLLQQQQWGPAGRAPRVPRGGGCFKCVGPHFQKDCPGNWRTAVGWLCGVSAPICGRLKPWEAKVPSDRISAPVRGFLGPREPRTGADIQRPEKPKFVYGLGYCSYGHRRRAWRCILSLRTTGPQPGMPMPTSQHTPGNPSPESDDEFRPLRDSIYCHQRKTNPSRRNPYQNSERQHVGNRTFSYRNCIRVRYCVSGRASGFERSNAMTELEDKLFSTVLNRIFLRS